MGRMSLNKGWSVAALATVVALAAPAAAQALDVDVTAAPYSAVGNGTTNDRVAIQHAIDDVAAAGGGHVTLPAGKTFLSGPVKLGANVRLRINGTLKQSQTDAHYATTPTHGHLFPGGGGYPNGDLASMHNQPMVYAANVGGVAVEGSGAIQLTRAATENATVHLMAIGFYRVHDYEILAIDVLGASTFSVALYTTTDGLVDGTRIISTHSDTNPAGGANTDGISIQNSQHIVVSNNYVRSGDDGIYVWASYADPRGVSTSWWSSAVPQASKDIEIFGNDVRAERNPPTLCCSGFSLIAWGAGAPDQRSVEISDVYVHDNRLAGLSAARCWCNSPFSTAGQSPMKRVRIENNTYTWGQSPALALKADVADFSTDEQDLVQVFSSRYFHNANFETTADAWWTSTGAAGATRSGETVLTSPAAVARLSEASGWVGYVNPAAGQTATFAQAYLPQMASEIPVDVGGSVRYRYTTRAVTDGTQARVVVRNRCTNAIIDDQLVTNTAWASIALAYTLPNAGCYSVKIGLESVGTDAGWAMIDDGSAINDTVIDSASSRVTKTGSWATYNLAADISGSHLVGLAAGANLSLPFNGNRIRIRGTRDNNLGKASVFVDGTLRGTIDYYAATRADGVIVFDASGLGAGNHTLELRTTGTKNAASSNVYTVFDAAIATP